MRVSDNDALSIAAKSSRPLVILYVYEDVHMRSDNYHESHHIFINQGLRVFDKKIKRLSGGIGVTFRHADSAVDVLEELHSTSRIHTIFCHREVGNSISIGRNQEVYRFVHQEGINLFEFSQDGVSVPRNDKTEPPSTFWMDPIAETPTELNLVTGISSSGMMSAEECGVKHRGTRPEAPKGGEKQAKKLLRSFLNERGKDYRFEVSSPLAGWSSCSRLSAYLAWGHISCREVYQMASAVHADHVKTKKVEAQRLAQNKQDESMLSIPMIVDGRLIDPSEEEVLNDATAATDESNNSLCEAREWATSLKSFLSRMEWRAKFMKQFHDDPSIEYS